MQPCIYGYARVSTREQNLSRQLDALAKAGVPRANVFADKASGKDFDRPEWTRLMKQMQAGDVLVVKSIDRLGRRYTDILDQWRFLTKQKGVDIVVLDIPLLDTRSLGAERGITKTFIADLMLQLLSYIAEVERENIRTRQAEGIAAARARGIHMGRPAKLRPSTYPQIKEAYLAGRLTCIEAATRLGVSVSTFARWRKEDETARGGAEVPDRHLYQCS